MKFTIDTQAIALSAAIRKEELKESLANRRNERKEQKAARLQEKARQLSMTPEEREAAEKQAKIDELNKELAALTTPAS